MSKTKEDKKSPDKYISLQKAAKLCPYSQDYLSLRARQGKLKAVKVGRNWSTTQTWLDNYVKKNNREKEKGIAFEETEKMDKAVAITEREKIKNIFPIEAKSVQPEPAEIKPDNLQDKVKITIREKKSLAEEEKVKFSKAELSKTRRKVFIKASDFSPAHLNKLIFSSAKIEKIKLNFVLDKTIGRLVAKGLAFINELARWSNIIFQKAKYYLLIKPARLLNLLAYRTRKFFGQPEAALIIILLFLLIISSVFVFYPKAGAVLAYQAKEVSKEVNSFGDRTINLLSEKSQKLVIYSRQLPKKIAGSASGEIEDLVDFSETALISTGQKIAQIPSRTIKFYKEVSQKNEGIKLAAKSKISQSAKKASQLAKETNKSLSDFIESAPFKTAALVKDIDQGFEFLSAKSIEEVNSLPRIVNLSLEKAGQSYSSLAVWSKGKKEQIAVLIDNLPNLIKQRLLNFSDEITQNWVVFSDRLVGLSQKLSKTSNNIPQKVSLAAKETLSNAHSSFKKGSASFLLTVDYLNRKISQKLDDFVKVIPQIPQKIPQKTNLALKKIKSKLGDAYLKLVSLFEPLTSPRTPLVRAPQKRLGQSVNQLERAIIEDIQDRFSEFRDDWRTGQKSSPQKDEGIIVVPLDEEREETQRKKIDELSQAFSDEVAIRPDETGQSGIIQPIFEDTQVQKYLYMMVPVKEGTEKEEIN